MRQQAELEATAVQTRRLNYYTAGATRFALLAAVTAARTHAVTAPTTPGGELIISDPRGLRAGYEVPQARPPAAGPPGRPVPA
eukprot:SAG11_NODE_3174_length_2633_cov_4.697316_2_plen_83_part_00